jgi:hypothetical protein
MRPRPVEIEGIFEARLGSLLAPGAAEEGWVSYEGREWRTPLFRLEGRKVWGATAMILAELAELLSSISA